MSVLLPLVFLVPVVSFADAADVPSEVRADLLNRCPPAAKKACRAVVARTATIDGDRIFALSLDAPGSAARDHHFFWSRQAGLHPAADFAPHLVKRKYRVSTPAEATALAALAVLFSSPRVERVFAAGDDLSRAPLQRLAKGTSVGATPTPAGFAVGLIALDHGPGGAAWRFVTVSVSRTGLCAVAGTKPL